MDPEEIYQEVLAEEQQKGSAPAIAEGRAKAARVRAEKGSPHPKEPKWWPGAQPHLDGGEAPAEAAPEPEAEEAPVAEEEPAPEPAPAPAVEAQPAQPEVTVAQAEADATPQTVAPPSDPGIETAAPAAAAAGTAPAAVATVPEAPPTVTQLPPEGRPAGVRSGTASGNRLRPEDGVSTEAQFEGQAAMYERRKVIDELVATGIPAAAVRREDDSGSPLLAFLYLLIPILALVVLANLDLAGGEAAEGEGQGGAGGGGGGIAISAANIQFSTDTIELPADEEATISFTNEDQAEHNIAIYEDESTETDLFTGEIISGGDSIDYQVGPFEAGTYYFQCDVHPSMNGDVEVS